MELFARQTAMIAAEGRCCNRGARATLRRFPTPAIRVREYCPLRTPAVDSPNIPILVRHAGLPDHAAFGSHVLPILIGLMPSALIKVDGIGHRQAGFQEL